MTVQVPYNDTVEAFEMRPRTIMTDCDEVNVEVSDHVAPLVEPVVVLADESEPTEMPVIRITRTRSCKDWKVQPDSFGVGGVPCTNAGGCCN